MKDLLLTPIQSQVMLSKASEIDLVTVFGGGKTFVAVTKMLSWLEHERNRTGVYVVSNHYSERPIINLISDVWDDFGTFRYADMTFEMNNGSVMYIVKKDMFDVEELDGLQESSFVFDNLNLKLNGDMMNFARRKLPKKGFILRCDSGMENSVVERTYFNNTNPFLKD